MRIRTETPESRKAETARRKDKAKRHDFYALAANARKHGRESLADELGDISEDLQAIKRRMSYLAYTTIEGRGAAAPDSSRGDSWDKTPAEVDASLAITDVRRRLRAIVADWCE